MGDSDGSKHLVGPAREHLADDGRRVDDKSFMQVVAMLAEGELTFAPPFDLATSAVLAINPFFGDQVEEFGAARRRVASYITYTERTRRQGNGKILIEIDQLLTMGRRTLCREVVNTEVADEAALQSLIAGLAEELRARTNNDQGVT